MSFVAVAIGGTAIVAAGAQIYAANQQAEAAQNAANSQSQASAAGIAEQQRQFDAVQKLLSPYVQAGNQALSAQGDLTGLNGPEAQRRALDQIQNSPQFSALVSQGENSILQNAAATGGLRGGNTQGSLAQFRPAALTQLINEQYARLGGISSLGQASAAGQAAAGQQSANAISGLYGQQGAAQAGAALAAGAQQQQYANAVSQFAGTIGGLNWGSLFGSPSASVPAPSGNTGTGAPFK